LDEKADKLIKIVDLECVDFAFMLGPVGKQKQFRPPDDLSKIDVASGFPAIFPVFTTQTDCCFFAIPNCFFTASAKQEISTFSALRRE